MSKIIGGVVTTPMKIPDFNQDDEKKSDYIKNRPLKEIQAIKSLQYYGDASIVPSDANLFTFTTDDATMTAKISASWGADLGDLVIPYECEVDGKIYKITRLDGYAFEGCNITSVVFPNSIEHLGDCTFSGCSGFTTIAIPNGILEIPMETFFMGSLRTIKIPSSVKYIYDRAFGDGTGLTDVFFEGTKEQWDEITILEGNEALLNATIHYEWVETTKGYVDEKISKMNEDTNDSFKSLQYYGDASIIPSANSLFEFKVDEETMTAKVSSIPEFYPKEDIIAIPYQYVDNDKTYTVTEINLCLYNADKWVFPNTLKKMSIMDFYSGGSFVVPDGIEKLSDYAFSSVFDLTNVSLPASLKYIGAGAFEFNLIDVYFRGTKAQWDAIEIDESNDNLFNATIHYEELVNIDSELSEESENAVQNKVVTTRINELDELLSNEIQGLNIQTYRFETDIGNINTALEELTPSIEDNGDTESLDIYIENNKKYYNGVVSTSIIGTIPEDIPLNFTSALYFVTPDTMPENYSQFPENIHFEGDSTDEGTFVPEPNMRYTIVFDFDGYMMNGYVKGVSTV